MVSPPETSYARSGEASIAYQVVGEGPLDLVLVTGPASHLDIQWEESSTARGFERLGSYSRLVRFDRRGTGLSDPVERALTLEQQMDDLRSVMRAVGTEHAALFGAVDAGLCAMYAATYPDQVSALVLANVAPAGGSVITEERRQELLDVIENAWGQGRFLSLFAPDRVGDPRFEEWWTRFERACVGPAMARQLIDLNMKTDLRGVLSAIRVPTLVLHSAGNPLVPIELAGETAALIPGARFVEGSGSDLYGWPGAEDPESDLIEEFLTGRRHSREPERVLAPSCSPTSSAPPTAPRGWATARGESSSVATTRSSVTSWSAGAEMR